MTVLGITMMVDSSGDELINMANAKGGYAARLGWHLLLVASPVLAVPIFIALILVVWWAADQLFGWREVSQFVRGHQQLVEQTLKNPYVHSFSLAHSPQNSAQLLIQCDVEDKSTFLHIESQLKVALQLRFLPHWEIEIHSHEPAGNRYGFADFGTFFYRLIVATVVSGLLAGVLLVFILKKFDNERRTDN